MITAEHLPMIQISYCMYQTPLPQSWTAPCHCGIKCKQLLNLELKYERTVEGGRNATEIRL
jgi:hypothetical protein